MGVYSVHAGRVDKTPTKLMVSVQVYRKKKERVWYFRENGYVWMKLYINEISSFFAFRVNDKDFFREYEKGIFVSTNSALYAVSLRKTTKSLLSKVYKCDFLCTPI
jgi:hypothetical protein